MPKFPENATAKEECSSKALKNLVEKHDSSFFVEIFVEIFRRNLHLVVRFEFGSMAKYQWEKYHWLKH